MKRDFKSEFSSSEGPQEKGQLTIRVPGLGNRPVPMSIWDKSLRLLGQAKTETQLSLDTGDYFMRVTMPDGTDEISAVQVTPGTVQEHVMAWQPQRPTAAYQSEQARVLKKRFVVVGGEPEYGYFIRFLTFSGGQWKTAPVAPDYEVRDCSLISGAVTSTLLVYARQLGTTYFMELRKAGGQPETIAAPIATNEFPLPCQYLVVDDGDSVHVTGTPISRDSGPIVYEYMNNDALQEVTEVMRNAEELLADKERNPIEAALGGYALLRIGDLEMLHDWPKHLEEWFPWLPDGAIIAGEFEARQRRYIDAITSLVEAVNRGLPVFTEGYSTLMSRLRQYRIYGEKLLGEKARDVNLNNQISAAWERIQKWSLAVDYSALLLTLKGVSLVGEDKNVEPIPERGWIKLTPTP